jgi:hypothetical protein
MPLFAYPFLYNRPLILGVEKIVSGVGRSFTLDRDGDYAKTRIAYDAFIFGKGRT